MTPVPLRRDDSGSTLPLIFFYAVLSIVLVLAVVAATSLYLERKRLFTLADGAALVGAESFELEDVGLTPEGPRAVLHPPDIRRSVLGYVAANGREEFTRLAVEQATTSDGRSATVTLSARWNPPVVSLLIPDGFRIDVTSTARSAFGAAG